MPVYDRRYEDSAGIEYVNIVMKVIHPTNHSDYAGPPRFGRLEINNEQLGYLPVYLNYEDAVMDYPNEQIHQIRVPIDGR